MLIFVARSENHQSPFNPDSVEGARGPLCLISACEERFNFYATKKYI